MRTQTAQGERASVSPEAYCESMCVFLLLSGKTRYVPEAAHVRVHQIWMGDRADDAKAASYTAQDLMIVERDIGRLAKYTFDMGGAGDLLSLALSVPPWEDLHELIAGRIAADQSRHDRCGRRRAAACRRHGADGATVAERSRTKPVQDRFVSSAVEADASAAGEVDQDRRGVVPTGEHDGAGSRIEIEVRRSGATRSANPEPRDSPMRNCASEVRCFASPRNDRCGYFAAAGCLALASIWPIASTTASKVSMVEACRAL